MFPVGLIANILGYAVNPVKEIDVLFEEGLVVVFAIVAPPPEGISTTTLDNKQPLSGVTVPLAVTVLLCS
jgi:hypothetical protein